MGQEKGGLLLLRPGCGVGGVVNEEEVPLTMPPPPQVTLVPTFDSAAMHTWYEETHSRHQALGVTVLGSNSMVCMEGESYLACKLEF